MAAWHTAVALSLRPPPSRRRRPHISLVDPAAAGETLLNDQRQKGGPHAVETDPVGTATANSEIRARVTATLIATARSRPLRALTSLIEVGRPATASPPPTPLSTRLSRPPPPQTVRLSLAVRPSSTTPRERSLPLIPRPPVGLTVETGGPRADQTER